MSRTLTFRQLNRTTLARQLLLARSTIGIVEAVHHLVGLQAQVSDGPYHALCSRLDGFTHEALTALIVERSLVRATSFRATLHLHTVDDLLGLRPYLQPVLDRMWQGAFGKRRFGDNDADAVHRAGARLLDEGPMTAGDLGKALQAQFPAGEPLAKAVLLQTREILIQIPPTRIWGSGHPPLLARVENWVPPPHRRALALDQLVLRYLGAFGPASIADMQSWSGLSRLAPLFDTFGDRLFTYTGEDGRTLYDVAGLPLAEPDTPAPVRFLGDFDNVILGYAARERILGPAAESNIFAAQRSFRSVLVDGFVAATWILTATRKRATLTIAPLRPLTRREAGAVQKEGMAFLAFLRPEIEAREVAIAS